MDRFRFYAHLRSAKSKVFGSKRKMGPPSSVGDTTNKGSGHPEFVGK